MIFNQAGKKSSRFLISQEGKLKSHPSFTSLLQNNLFRETVFSLLQVDRKQENRDYRMESPFQQTPPTPHVMVRRSASQKYNLSRDMIAKTVRQANHCFSFPTSLSTKTQKKVINNEQIIIMPEMANAVICPDTGKSLKHQEFITKLGYKIKWMRSTANEINRLYNTNTIRFIRRSNIPKGRKVTYGSFVVDIKDHKEERERTRLTIGGDQIEYPGEKSTRTAGLTTAKILINSVISTLGAKFLVIDIKNFYLNTPLERFEYMVINLSSLPQEKIDKYDLIELAQDRKVYIEIQKGMYGLPQVQRNLAKDGYRPTQHTHGLWKHDTRPISFSLVVDDFGVKYAGREHAQHLMQCIKKIITFPATGKAVHTAAWHWNGTTKKEHWTYLCRDTSRQHYINTNMLPQHAQNMHHTRGIHQCMAPKHSMWRMKQLAQHFPPKT
jgi:hypothetical protein